MPRDIGNTRAVVSFLSNGCILHVTHCNGSRLIAGVDMCFRLMRCPGFSYQACVDGWSVIYIKSMRTIWFSYNAYRRSSYAQAFLHTTFAFHVFNTCWLLLKLVDSPYMADGRSELCPLEEGIQMQLLTSMYVSEHYHATVG